MSCASFICAHTYVFLCSYFCDYILSLLFVLRVDKVHPRLKRRYHVRLERVKEYLETVKDFDKQSSSLSSLPWSGTFQQNSKEHQDHQEE